MSGEEEKKYQNEERNFILQERKLAFDGMKFVLEVGIEGMYRGMRLNFAIWQGRIRFILLVCLATLGFLANYSANHGNKIEVWSLQFCILVSSISCVLLALVFVSFSVAISSNYADGKSDRGFDFFNGIKIGLTEVEYCEYIKSLSGKVGAGPKWERRKFYASLQIFPLCSSVLWIFGSILFFVSIWSK